MERIEKKYRSLRVIAWFFKFGAWISFICGFVLFFAVLFGGKILFHVVEGNGMTLQYLEAGRVLGSLLVLGGFLLNALVFYAISSTIYLFIDLEANTRQIAALLAKQRQASPPAARPSPGETREVPS